MTATGAAIAIRPARPGEAAMLADLSTQLGYPADAALIEQRLLRVREQNAGQVFVAVDVDRVVGWTHVVPRLQLEEIALTEIAGLVVADDERGRGVGARLLAAAEDWSRANGFTRMRVRSNVVRERAHRFYVREGYAERKRQVVFEKDLG